MPKAIYVFILILSVTNLYSELSAKQYQEIIGAFLVDSFHKNLRRSDAYSNNVKLLKKLDQNWSKFSDTQKNEFAVMAIVYFDIDTSSGQYLSELFKKDKQQILNYLDGMSVKTIENLYFDKQDSINLFKNWRNSISNL